MQLPKSNLEARLEQMPTAGHTEVYHVCHKDAHRLCGMAGNLATVTSVQPELPEVNLDGVFVMRLHPKTDTLQATEGVYQVRLQSAVSYPHATIFSASNL